MGWTCGAKEASMVRRRAERHEGGLSRMQPDPIVGLVLVGTLDFPAA